MPNLFLPVERFQRITYHMSPTVDVLMSFGLGASLLTSIGQPSYIDPY